MKQRAVESVVAAAAAFGILTVVFGLFVASSAQTPRNAGNGSPRATTRPATSPSDQAKAPDGVKFQRNVEYAKVDQKPLCMDLYTPSDAAKPLPLIVFVHGGGWYSMDKRPCPLMPLAARGYVVASINYRFSSEAIFPAQIEDCKAAIRFLRANAQKFFIDPDHIGVCGDSAGGHLAALLGVSGDVKDLEGKVGEHLDQSSRVHAVVDCCGPADLPLFLKKLTPSATRAVGQLLGGMDDKVKDLAIKASPVTYVKKEAPPFLIIHGDRDTTVPISQSESLNSALKAAGVDITFHVVNGGGHFCIAGGIGNNLSTADMVKMIGDFFDKHLRKTTNSPAGRKAGAE